MKPVSLNVHAGGATSGSRACGLIAMSHIAASGNQYGCGER